MSLEMKDNKGKSGVYKILNTVNGKMYIGRTKDFYKRYYQYVSDVKTRNIDRINRYLEASFHKYGFDKFSFTVLEFCTIEECPEKELYWIQELNTTQRNKGYNLRTDTGTCMITHPETSALISNNLKLQWASGVRDNHAEKLKQSWNTRDREAQGAMFSKILTKYLYVVEGYASEPLVLGYKTLKEYNLHSCLSSFHKKEVDKVKFKGYTISRVKPCNNMDEFVGDIDYDYFVKEAEKLVISP